MQRHSDAKVATLSLAVGWIPILTQASADAFLVFVDEAAIVEHGMPAHLQPTVIYADELPLFKSSYPKICATALNAGGTFSKVSTTVQPTNNEIN